MRNRTGLPAFAGARVLVAEDQAVIAMDLEEVLRGLGCVVVGPVPTVAGALRLVGPGTLDAALLDMGLRDGLALPVAEALAAAGVPFALVTGHEAELPGPPALRGAPRLDKPFRVAELHQALARLLVPAAQASASPPLIAA